MDKSPVTQIDYQEDIIQVKLMNVEKNALFVGNIFQIISQYHINVDMISQIMLEDEIRIDFTCSSDDQEKLNQAIICIKENHPRIEVYQNRNVGKIKVEGQLMKEEVGVAATLFDIFGKQQVPILQITTSEISISYVLEKQYVKQIVQSIKNTYHI